MQWHPSIPEEFPSSFFVSYSSIDADTASGLERALISAGHTVWRDRTSLRVGDKWLDEVRFAISSCAEVIVLLTPSSSTSMPVLLEIEHAKTLRKRINLFATVEPKDYPALYAQISEINYVKLPSKRPTTSDFLTYIAPRSKALHPLGLREFEWTAVRTVFPRFSDLVQGNRLDRSRAQHYLSYLPTFQAAPERCTGALWMNFGLCAGALGDVTLAVECLEKAMSQCAHPTIKYFYAITLLGRQRPRHLPPKILDRSLAFAEQALAERKSPLAALLVATLLADSGKAHGPALRELFSNALSGLQAHGLEPKHEILRHFFLLPYSADMTLPVPYPQFRIAMQRAVGENP